MSNTTASPALAGVVTNTESAVANLGFPQGSIIQEFYLDDDADEALRLAVEETTGNQLVDEEYEDVADGALVWFRDEDGSVDDLADLLVDASANLDEGGLIWVLTPKTVSKGRVEPQMVEEAAETAGLRATSSAAVSPNWLGIRLTSRPRRR